MDRSSEALDAALAQALAGYAEWVGLKCPERAPSWVERLRMNDEELAGFRRAPTPEGPSYVAWAVTPNAPEVGPEPAGEAVCTGHRDPVAAWQRARDAGRLRAFTRLPDQAPRRLSAADGYLADVPFVVKDLIGVAGWPCSGGSVSGSDEPCRDDAAAVAAMTRQGAVCIGLTNLHELALGPSSVNPVFGAVVNPAAPGRTPGGSSGGSAAAVAAGIVDIALATDTGGSIRIPAACCGVVGFKPSFGAVPRKGSIDIAESLDHIGPIGRTVRDCAMALAALTGLPRFPGLPCRGLAGLRVGVLGGFFQDPLDPAVRAALDDMQRVLQADGASLHEVRIDGIEEAPAIQFVTISTEAAASQAERLRDHGDRLGEDVRVRLEMASLLPGHWYLKAQRMRRVLVERIEAPLREVDLLLCATMRAPAPAVDAAEVIIGGRPYPLHTAVSNLTLPYSLSGLPALALPWGRSPDGVPLSLQIAGARGRDWQVLEVAHRLERLGPGGGARRPER